MIPGWSPTQIVQMVLICAPGVKIDAAPGVKFLTRFSTKILVMRLVNGGLADGQADGRAYPKWRQTEVSAQ